MFNPWIQHDLFEKFSGSYYVWLPYVCSFVLTCFVWLLLYAQRRSARRNELNSWVIRVHNERENRVHASLGMVQNINAEQFTASQTRELIVSKKLNVTQNIVYLAKRCRMYGRNEDGMNAITEELYDEGYEASNALHTNTTLKDAPPLYGVPISVKDCFSIKGTYSTCGMACRLKEKRKDDSLVVKVLRSAGAIPLCKGNTAQLMMLAETFNRIWGRTRNPWNLERTPGGSSGGDAALVSSGCVPLALVTDGAGSIRIPASFCGVVGFKTTSCRLSCKGNIMPRKDNKHGAAVVFPASVGPMARSVDDCALFMKAVCVPEFFQGDRNVAPVPFNEEAYRKTRQLKIGFFRTDNWFEPCSTSKRALQETIDALKCAGHECVPFCPPTDGWDNYGLFAAIRAAEGGMCAHFEALEGEEMIPEYALMVLLACCPNWLRWIIAKVVSARCSHLLRQTRSNGISVHNLWKLTADLEKMRAMWSDAMETAGIDALVYPGFPIPAPRHGTITRAGNGVSYMLIANMLKWPSGVVPVTTVYPNEQHYRMEDLPQEQRDGFARAVSDSMKNSVGLPISVSVMTPAYQDETCLHVMKEIERLVCFQAKPSAFEQPILDLNDSSKGRKHSTYFDNQLSQSLLCWAYFLTQGWKGPVSRACPWSSCVDSLKCFIPSE